MTGERVRGMVAIRDATNRLLERQLEECSDEEVASLQAELNQVYDSFYCQVWTTQQQCK